MTTSYVFTRILIMAGVTYLIRVLPMLMIKTKLENKFLKSFLYYIPYAVLAAMVIPDIFTSTASIWSALVGLIIAVILSLFKRSLLTVALASCISVYICEWVLQSYGVI